MLFRDAPQVEPGGKLSAPDDAATASVHTSRKNWWGEKKLAREISRRFEQCREFQKKFEAEEAELRAFYEAR